LTNGGFETGQIDPWQGASGAQITATAAHSGSYGVRLPSAQLLTQGWIAVTPGRTYVVTAWFKWAAFDGTDWGYDVFDVLNSSFQTEASVTNLAGRYPQDTWVKLALTFVPRTDGVQVRFGVFGPKATVDQGWDDLQLFEKVGNLPPTIAPTATPTSGNAPLAVAFQANGDDPDGAIVMFQWDFDDGSIATTAVASHTFTAKRVYTVRLTAWDNDGASATQTLPVTVLADSNPGISITGPTALDTYTTAATTISLSGTASAPSGLTVQSAVWDNINTDAAGIITVSPAGTIAWSAPSIPLKPGANELLTTVTDSAGAVSTDRVFVTRTFTGPAISNVVLSQTSVRIYEKLEVTLDVETVADNPFFRYDPAPPPGVPVGTGVTVEGVFTTPSGVTLVQPGFLSGDVTTSQVSGQTHYEETGRLSWRVRFSPTEVGTYTVSLRVQDASGSTQVSAGTFTAGLPARRGFIRVSADDSRYFEFSNGDLYYPIGPASGPNYGQYATNGPNLERPWMGGEAAYSTNWARWMRVDLQLGNEGFDNPLTYLERYPSHELSREIVYPAAHRIWMGASGDENYFPELKSGREYQIKLRIKTVGIAGPATTGIPYGFMVKTHAFPTSTIDSDLRSAPSIVPVVSNDREWHTILVRYTATARDTDDYISLLLDNVTSGRVYVDQFSVREALSNGSLGGELIRHSRADLHTYIEQRPAAYFDWQVQQGEQNGVFFKYVVQDKRDWVPNHLTRFGAFAAIGDGYFQQDGTKAKWLQQQWWRYIVARWGYSTAVHSWELCNEADPNDTNVWRHTQDFARFLHQTNAHRQMATTSFWCCWKPEFWSDETTYPDVDYADLHEYTNDSTLGLDMVEWILSWSQTTSQQPAGKPVILAETGIGYAGQAYFEDLKRPNPGIWYHNLLWAELNALSGMTAPTYWWSEHFAAINQNQVARPFYQFVSGLDVNRGGYVDAAVTSSNSQIRTLGQKNLTKGTAYLWVQNKLHNWHNVMGVQNPTPITAQSGTVTVRMAPNTRYTIERWNTYTGALISTETLQSSATGDLTSSVSNLTDDFAVRVRGPVSGAPSPATGVRISR
jgi:PKD repeat protein